MPLPPTQNHAAAGAPPTRRPTPSVRGGPRLGIVLSGEHGHEREDPSAPAGLNSRGVDVSSLLARRGTLETLNAYVMSERPAEATSPFVFLLGGVGKHREEPLSYAGLARMFARACERADIRQPWMTPHALRHTHATRMWEGGMRELTLQKRLGHASPESTRIYTRVSDATVVAEYKRALGGDPA